ncbi:MAG: hypothetical protein KC431_06365, partial [Myxococcales bacterium]|nr:hypothetical protein [Myxococcales bacterium]
MRSWLPWALALACTSACTKHSDEQQAGAEIEAASALSVPSEEPTEAAVADGAGEEGEAAGPVITHRCIPRELPTGSLLYLPQPDEGPENIFDAHLSPVGERLAVGECRVWDADDMLWLGEFGPRGLFCDRWPEAGVDPCVDWRPLEGPTFSSPGPESEEELETDAGLRLQIDGVHLRGLEADGRTRFSAVSGGYIGLSARPDGERFAAIREDAVELRNAADGELIALISLVDPAPLGAELEQVAVLWVREEWPAVLTIRSNPGCPEPSEQEDEDETGDETGTAQSDEEACHLRYGWDQEISFWELRRWPAGPGPAAIEVQTLYEDLLPSEGGEPPVMFTGALVDPRGRWLLLDYDGGAPHDSPVGRIHVPLVGPFNGPESLRDPTYEFRRNRDGSDTTNFEGGWVAGNRLTRTQWITEYRGDGEGESWTWSWATIELAPAFAR